MEVTVYRKRLGAEWSVAPAYDADVLAQHAGVRWCRVVRGRFVRGARP